MYVFPNTISFGFDFADGSDSLWMIIGLSKEYFKISFTS